MDGELLRVSLQLKVSPNCILYIPLSDYSFLNVHYKYRNDIELFKKIF